MPSIKLCALLLLLFVSSTVCAPARAVVPRKAPRQALPADFNPYRVLRAYRGASQKDIRSAYRRALNVMGRSAAKGGHGQEASAEDAALMEQIKLAYEVLSDDEWKAEWDAANPAESSPTPLPEWEKERDL
jgi:preprotein translocase subunit Sec63